MDESARLDDAEMAFGDFELKDTNQPGGRMMRIAVVASECFPFGFTGGLGEVLGALPRYLARLGHQV